MIFILGLKSSVQPEKGKELIDKIQPDMEELEELTKKEEVKNLGKLQYSLDYDFQQNNVSQKSIILPKTVFRLKNQSPRFESSD